MKLFLINVAVYIKCTLTLVAFGGSSDAVMSDADIAQIVSIHNTYRASCGAADMNKLTWNPLLAIMAGTWSAGCNWAHGNPTVNLSSLGYPNSYIGQNIFAFGNPTAGANYNAMAVGAWFAEKMFYSYSPCKSGLCGTCQAGQVCGHYTQVVWASTYEVGCGYTTCPVLNGVGWAYPTLFFVCNYGPGGNYPSNPFTFGPPCTRCDPLRPSCDTGLCTTGAPQNIYSIPITTLTNKPANWSITTTVASTTKALTSTNKPTTTVAPTTKGLTSTNKPTITTMAPTSTALTSTNKPTTTIVPTTKRLTSTNKPTTTTMVSTTKALTSTNRPTTMTVTSATKTQTSLNVTTSIPFTTQTTNTRTIPPTTQTTTSKIPVTSQTNATKGNTLWTETSAATSVPTTRSTTQSNVATPTTHSESTTGSRITLKSTSYYSPSRKTTPGFSIRTTPEYFNPFATKRLTKTTPSFEQWETIFRNIGTSSWCATYEDGRQTCQNSCQMSGLVCCACRSPPSPTATGFQSCSCCPKDSTCCPGPIVCSRLGGCCPKGSACVGNGLCSVTSYVQAATSYEQVVYIQATATIVSSRNDNCYTTSQVDNTG